MSVILSFPLWNLWMGHQWLKLIKILNHCDMLVDAYYTVFVNNTLAFCCSGLFCTVQSCDSLWSWYVSNFNYIAENSESCFESLLNLDYFLCRDQLKMVFPPLSSWSYIFNLELKICPWWGFTNLFSLVYRCVLWQTKLDYALIFCEHSVDWDPLRCHEPIFSGLQNWQAAMKIYCILCKLKQQHVTIYKL